MENWKNEISQFLIDRFKLVDDVTDATAIVIDELKTHFEESGILKETRIHGRKPKDATHPSWIIYIHDFEIEFDLEMIHSARLRHDESGFLMFDSNIKVEDAIRKIITEELKIKSK